MIAAIVILASSLVTPPAPPVVAPEGSVVVAPAGALPNTIIKGDVRIDVVRDSRGKIVKAVVSRVDGKPMTSCDAYSALTEQEYRCLGSQCGDYFYIATGSGSGDSEEAACNASRENMCGYATCGLGSPQFCTILSNSVMAFIGEVSGGCLYSGSGWCFISWDCSS